MQSICSATSLTAVAGRARCSNAEDGLSRVKCCRSIATGKKHRWCRLKVLETGARAVFYLSLDRCACEGTHFLMAIISGAYILR